MIMFAYYKNESNRIVGEAEIRPLQLRELITFRLCVMYTLDLQSYRGPKISNLQGARGPLDSVYRPRSAPKTATNSDWLVLGARNTRTGSST